MKRADDGGSRRRDGNREQDCPAGKGEASFGELEGEEIQFELSAPVSGCSCHRLLAQVKRSRAYC